MEIFADTAKLTQPELTQVQSAPPVDYYIGRCVLQSSALVEQIAESFPEVELITHKNHLVVPLMRRHRARNQKEAAIYAAREELNKAMPATLEKLEIDTRRLLIGRSRARTSVVRLELKSFSPAFKQLVEEGKCLKKLSPIFHDRFDVNPSIRIADTPSPYEAEEIMELCNQQQLPNPITLSRAIVCTAPARINRSA